ncbi:DUF4453 domain-containing protein [Primorskyibacter sp. S87]|uniref:DUF4453 domain-containing protein n=1 Tax=Primorskyibacter sp. S87 TaxID=3415126 RepID=UPI003C7B71E4
MIRQLQTAALSALILLPFTGEPAVATDACEDLWYTRNLIMHRAGYCFGSKLGQAMFDTSDCSESSIALGRLEQLQVEEIRDTERELGCEKNTNRDWLNIQDRLTRQLLEVLPINQGYGSTCIGWAGEEVPLRSAPDNRSPKLGVIRPGDDVGYEHVSMGDWSFVSTYSEGWNLTGGGWYDTAQYEEVCQRYTD